MKTQKYSFSLSGLVRLVGVFIILFGLIGLFPQAHPARAQALPPSAPNPIPPSTTVKLIFIHHSTGENWLADDYGGLGLALSQNNYFVSDTNYGWGPNAIGDRTDIPNWTEWFTSVDTPTYMSALYTEYEQHSGYTRTLADPGGENQIVMFKSCFPNSALEGSPSDPPSADGWLTVGHAKWVYNEILTYFGAHPEKLFIVITAPPLSDGTYAANARAFNQWLMNNWLTENSYTQANVAVFDFYNVLTGPNNHHRFFEGAEQHIFTPGMNTLYYPSGDDHPSVAGSQKATDEFIELLNVFYHRWNPSAPTCYSLTLNSNPASGGTVEADTAPNCGAAFYADGTVVNLTAAANFGYVFTNWSGDASGSAASVSVTMDTVKTATANFSAVPVLPPDGAVLVNNRPTFDWPDHPGAIGYQIQVSRNAGFTQLVVNASLNGGTNSIYTPVSSLPANSALHWRYRAKLTATTYTIWSHVYMLQTANPPPAPLLVAPVVNALVTSPTVKLDWNNIIIPTGTVFQKYEVQMATDTAFTVNVTLADAPISEYTTPALTPNTKYYWRVRAYNSLGQYGNWSAARYFRAALSAPNSLTPGTTVLPEEQLLTRRPTFTWNVVPGATSYTVEVSTVNTFATKAINANATTNSYTHAADLAANTSYFWRVKANGANGPSLYSQVRMFRTANPPSVPTLASPLNNALVTTTTPLLNWNNSTVPAGTTFRWYEVQMDTSNTFGGAVSANTTEFDLNNSQYTPAPLLNGVTYYWRVRSINTAGEFSGWSLVRSLRVVYAAPTLTLPLNGATGVALKPTFTWNPIAGVTSYTLQVSKNNTFTLLVANKTIYAPTTTYVYTLNLLPNTTYYWRVRANGAYGPGLWQSPAFSFTTAP